MSRTRLHGNLLASLFFLLIVAIPNLRGQAVGEILGSVFDPTGAVIANAKVTAVQNGTEMTRRTVTSSSGTYFLTSLPVGTFAVTAEATGFKSASSVVTLDVDQHREVNFTLTLAGTAASVHVTAAPTLLNTTNGTLGGLVTGEQVATLPLNGRDITNLAFLQPGVNYDINRGAYYSDPEHSAV